MNKANKWLTLASIIFTSVIAYSSLILLPIYTDIFVKDYHFDRSAAGFIIALQLIFAAATSLFISGKIKKISLRTVALFGMLTVISANGLPILFKTEAALIATRGILGIGDGMIIAALNAAIARTKNPTYYFSISKISSALSGVIFFLVLPGFIMEIGANAIFGFVVLLAILSLTLLKGFPGLDAKVEDKVNKIGIISLLKNPGNWNKGVYVLLAIFLIYAGGQGYWVYLSRIGQSVGLSAEAVGQWIAVGSFLSLFGPWAGQRLSAILSERYILNIIIISIAFKAILMIIAVYTSYPAIYVISTLVIQFLSLFTITLLMGYLAFLDPNGRSSAAAGASINLGTAVAPAISGALLLQGDYQLIGWNSVILSFLGVLLIYFSGKFIRRRNGGLTKRIYQNG